MGSNDDTSVRVDVCSVPKSWLHIACCMPVACCMLVASPLEMSLKYRKYRAQPRPDKTEPLV